MNPWTKSFILGLLTLIMVWGVSGCMNKKPNHETTIDRMIAHLEEKYGEEFVPLSFNSSNWAYGYDSLYAYPKKGSEKDNFEVRGTKKKEGTYAIHDGYFGIFIKPQYEKVMSGFVSEIYDEFKLYTNFGDGVLPDRLNKDTPFEEIYDKDELFSSDTVVFVKEASAKGIDDGESLHKIAVQMQAKKMVGSVRLYVVFDERFETVSIDSLDLTPIQKRDYFIRERKNINVTKSLGIVNYEEEVQMDG
ncbi:hypothetical protein ACE3MQ_26750 [Paenibacillus lentus]|uniref:hypothetical protein n=1 Tax=Paenibacillus lentus TaxID=1338368 RepID=UPI003657032E